MKGALPHASIEWRELHRRNVASWRAWAEGAAPEDLAEARELAEGLSANSLRAIAEVDREEAAAVGDGGSTP